MQIGPNFVIEKNILKGEYKEVDLSANGVGEVILKRLSDYPNHISQVSVNHVITWA